jgi:peptidoglycan/LPS O-acetylase OafA/YrhL
VGWVGVDLFFVLSGFLVSGLLFIEYRKYGSLRIGRFLIRRGFKIYPAFYALLLTTLLVRICSSTLTENMARRILAEALYLQNYLPGAWNHTWSLAVEEHFYLLLPLALCVMVRRNASFEDPFKALMFGTWAIGILTLLLRVRAVVTHAYVNGAMLYPTHLRIDSLAWGVLLSYLYHVRRAQFVSFVGRRKRSIAVASGVLLTPPLLWTLDQSGFLSTVGLTFLAWGFAGILALTLTLPFELPLRLHFLLRASLGRFLEGVGVYSYSIYLWHMPVQQWMMPYLRTKQLFDFRSPTQAYVLETAIYLCSSLGCGIAMARAIERPLLRLRDHLFPSRSGGLPVSARPQPKF